MATQRAVPRTENDVRRDIPGDLSLNERVKLINNNLDQLEEHNAQAHMSLADQLALLRRDLTALSEFVGYDLPSNLPETAPSR